MSRRDRSLIVITTLAAMAVIALVNGPLFHEMLFRRWATPLQPRCLMQGAFVGAVVGVAIGCLLFLACIRRRRTIFRFVVAICVGMAISGVLGAIAAFATIEPAWPSETQYGMDGDHLLVYGFAAALMGVVFSTGLLATFVPIKES